MCGLIPTNDCKGNSNFCSIGAPHTRRVMTQPLSETMQVGTWPKSNLKVLLQSTATS